MNNELQPGQPVTWRRFSPAGYGWHHSLIAVVVRTSGKRIGIAALKLSGEWTPHYVRPDSLITTGLESVVIQKVLEERKK